MPVIQDEDGEPLPKAIANGSYSGKFVVWVDKGLHQALTMVALREGKSLHAYCVGHLQRTIRPSSPQGRSSSGQRAPSRKRRGVRFQVRLLGRGLKFRIDPRRSRFQPLYQSFPAESIGGVNGIGGRQPGQFSS
ncbi:MAG: toxin-antitoxin system HicB family antitoxin [Nitrospira sp.]|nr:toxin-antitoxin system HicB family antitoxin [Nitrospira sp.]